MRVRDLFMTFTTKKVNTQDLGEYLEACRQKSGLSLPEVAKVTQVQPKYIIALEQGRFRDLPAAVYVKGFLASLAKIYRLDSGSIYKQFLTEQGIARNLAIAEPEKQKKSPISLFVVSPKTLTILGAAILGLSSLTYLYFQVSSLKRPPSLEVFYPEADGTVNSSLFLVRGKTEPGASVYLNNQAIVVDATGNFRENLSLGPGTNQLVIRAVNKFDKETIISRSILLAEKDIAGSFTEAYDTSGEVATSTPENMEQTGLTLEILIGPEAAWIHIETDGGREEYSGTMLKGASRKIVAENKIVVTTGNAGSTRISLNDKDLGILGKEGEIIRDLEFTK